MGRSREMSRNASRKGARMFWNESEKNEWKWTKNSFSHERSRRRGPTLPKGVEEFLKRLASKWLGYAVTALVAAACSAFGIARIPSLRDLGVEPPQSLEPTPHDYRSIGS